MRWRIFILMIIAAMVCSAELSAQSIVHDTRVGQFKAAKTSRKAIQPNSNRRNRTKRNSPKKLRTKALQKSKDKEFPVKFSDSIVSQLSYNLGVTPSSIHDSISRKAMTVSDSMFCIVSFSNRNAGMQNSKNKDGISEHLLDRLDAVDYRTDRPITIGNFSFMGMQERENHPLVLTTQRLSVLSKYESSHLALTTGINVNRYFALGIKTQYGFHGTISYSFSPHFCMTVFGEYYNSVPWFYMASFPYVATNRYGGYFTYRSNNIGTHIGAERYYDPFARQWIFRPIVTPFVKVSNKFFIELPLGGLLKASSERLSHQNRRRGPIY